LSKSEKLIDWLLNSKIYNGQAYISHYSEIKKGSIYPEITAYAISLSCILYEKRNEKAFLDRAETCAKYLMEISKNGAIPSFTDNLSYTFDTGIYLSGLFDIYAVTNKQIYLDEAKKSLNWLYSLWDGKQFAAVEKVPENKNWYQTPAVHLAKLVIPLLKAAKYLKVEKYKTIALELLENYKQLQNADGSFRINDSSDEVMTHPHCYVTEGFLYAYHVTKEQSFLEVTKRSSDWLCRIQNSSGAFYRIYSSDKTDGSLRNLEKIQTSDATAQATRIWKLLGVNQEGIKKAYKYLDSELKDNGLRLLKSEFFRGKIFSWLRPVYSWPTLFYLHSLTLPFGQIEYCSELF